MSYYSVSEDLVLLKAAVEDQEEAEDTQLLLSYASLGLVAVGTTASVWMCLRQSFDLRREDQVCDYSDLHFSWPPLSFFLFLLRAASFGAA